MTTRKKKGYPVRALLKLIQPGARLIQTRSNEADPESWEAFILCGKMHAHISAATVEALETREWVSAPRQMNSAGTMAEFFLTPSGRNIAQEIIEYRDRFSQLALWGDEVLAELEELDEEEATQETLF
jgi:hypothetical protein